MTAARIVLAIVVVSTGLFTGLVLYIVGMFQPLLSQLTGAEFTTVMDRFLPAGVPCRRGPGHHRRDHGGRSRRNLHVRDPGQRLALTFRFAPGRWPRGRSGRRSGRHRGSPPAR